MSNELFSLDISILKETWRDLSRCIPARKVGRSYESAVLVESDSVSGLVSFRVAHDRGGMRIILRTSTLGKEKLVVSEGGQWAFDADTFTTILPFLGSAQVAFTHPGDESDRIILVGDNGKVQQYAQSLSTVVDDFPGDSFYAMPVQLQFEVPGIDIILRQAMSSANNNPKLTERKEAGLHIRARDGTLLLESADGPRGVSRVSLIPPVCTPDPFEVVVFHDNAEMLGRVLAGYKGSVTLRSDVGGTILTWDVGDTSYVSRIIDDTYFNLDKMFHDDHVLASASVPASDFKNILGLISAMTDPNIAAQAVTTFQEDGNVSISSPSTSSPSTATMSGMCAGELPHTIIINARQVHEVVADMGLKKGALVHLQAQYTVNERDGKRVSSPTLQIKSGEYPYFTHVAILMQPRKG